MGGFFGIASKQDCMVDVFFGTDYHSHLSARRGGMAAYDSETGLQREIHNIENSPFRTKFENIFDEMKGVSAIGCISDSDPQPLIVRSRFGAFAIATIGVVNNADALIKEYLSVGGHFNAMTGGKVNTTELIGALIAEKSSFKEGIQFAQSVIDGTANILILTETGSLIAARDRMGRIPVQIGKDENGYCASFEEFAFTKLGFEPVKELGPGEIVELTPDSMTQLAPAREEMRMCAFLWSYYGYPTSTYEGINVEAMRYRNGEAIAERDMAQGRSLEEVDFVAGVPDSGTPHAIGYANRTGKPFARAFIKYTPTWSRSFTPARQKDRNKIAKMKQIPVHELIAGKNLLFVDDSIVRGTQLQETVDFLYENGAKSVHMRSACPPIMYGCKYLSFSRSTSDMDLITRRTIVELEGEEGLKYISEYADGDTERGKRMRKEICNKFKFASLGFQTVEGVVKAIGLDPCKLCTYCWNGKE